jgi:hypothetical protein
LKTVEWKEKPTVVNWAEMTVGHLVGLWAKRTAELTVFLWVAWMVSRKAGRWGMHWAAKKVDSTAVLTERQTAVWWVNCLVGTKAGSRAGKKDFPTAVERELGSAGSTAATTADGTAADWGRHSAGWKGDSMAVSTGNWRAELLATQMVAEWASHSVARMAATMAGHWVGMKANSTADLKAAC